MSNYPAPNPFQSPVQSGKPSVTASEGGAGNRETVQLLKQTQPWALTIGIMMCIAAALMFIGGIFVFFMSVTSLGHKANAGPMLALSIIYPLMALLYLAPAVYLFKYSSGIGKYSRQPSTANLNLALKSQKSFWKFCGIATIVGIGLYLLLIILAVIIGVVAAMQ